MPSNSYQKWQHVRCVELDQIDHAHGSVAGRGRGRRYATQQINYAYAALLSSQFQGFCRDLHTESVYHVTQNTHPIAIRNVLNLEFTFGRKLDRGNPNPGNLGADFNRLGVNFWHEAQARDKRSAARRNHLDTLNLWRNAIAHHDFTDRRLGGQSRLNLQEVRSWRKACEGLARTFDILMKDHIFNLVGLHPWP